MTVDANDLVLSVVHRAGSVPGRTALQKLCYFANDRIGTGIPFRAHYYGPFSRNIAASTDLLVISNFLSESVATGALSAPSVQPSGGVSTEWEQHSYRITPDGERFFERREKNFSEQYRVVDRVVDSLRSETGFDATRLSELAKIHFLKSNTGANSPQELMARAGELQWKVSLAAVERALNTLERLKL